MNNLEIKEFFNRPNIEFEIDEGVRTSCGMLIKNHNSFRCPCGYEFEGKSHDEFDEAYKTHFLEEHPEVPPWNENLDHTMWRLFQKCLPASKTEPIFIKQTLSEYIESWQRRPGRKDVKGYFGPFFSWQEAIMWLSDKPHRYSNDDYSYIYEIINTSLPEVGNLDTLMQGDRFVTYLENYVDKVAEA